MGSVYEPNGRGIRFRPRTFLTMLRKKRTGQEDALQALEDGGLNLNVLTFPKRRAAEILRLRQEAQLSEKGLNPKELNPTTPCGCT